MSGGAGRPPKLLKWIARVCSRNLGGGSFVVCQTMRCGRKADGTTTESWPYFEGGADEYDGIADDIREWCQKIAGESGGRHQYEITFVPDEPTEATGLGTTHTVTLRKVDLKDREHNGSADDTIRHLSIQNTAMAQRLLDGMDACTRNLAAVNAVLEHSAKAALKREGIGWKENAKLAKQIGELQAKLDAYGDEDPETISLMRGWGAVAAWFMGEAIETRPGIIKALAPVLVTQMVSQPQQVMGLLQSNPQIIDHVMENHPEVLDKLMDIIQEANAADTAA